MATPTTVDARDKAWGAKKGATWGTAVAVGALGGLLLKTVSGFDPKRDYYPSKEFDTPMVKTGILGPAKNVDFTLNFDMRHDPGMLGTLIAMLFGTAGAPTKVGPTLCYAHTLAMANSTAGLFATVVGEGVGSIWECHSAKVMGLSLKAGAGRLEASLKCRGDDIVNDSSVNTATQVDALTYVDRENPITFPVGATVKMNAESGADVAASAALVGVNSIDIDFERPGFDAVFGAGGTVILEPIQGDYPTAKIKLGFARRGTDNEAYFATWKAGTTQKALIMFQGALIETTYYYQWGFFFPRLRMVDTSYTWDQIMKGGLELQAEESAVAPTGMTLTRPYIVAQNKTTTDYLA